MATSPARRRRPWARRRRTRPLARIRAAAAAVRPRTVRAAPADEPVSERSADEPSPDDAAAEADAEERSSRAGRSKRRRSSTNRRKMDWYILKVQSNREESIREGLLRRVAIAGLEYYFGDVIVPIERVTEFKGGKKRVIKRKLYPGYLVVHMEINDDTWFLVRETPGIGDFTGAGRAAHRRCCRTKWRRSSPSRKRRATKRRS